jgi:hypothetical protein
MSQILTSATRPSALPASADPTPSAATRQEDTLASAHLATLETHLSTVTVSFQFLF